MKHYRLPALLLAGAMTFGLASCGSSSSSSGSASSAASGSGASSADSAPAEIPQEALDDVVSYLTDGAYSKDDVVATVGDTTVSAAQMLYWTAYQQYYMTNYYYRNYGYTFQMSDTLQDGTTVADSLLATSVDTAMAYAVATQKAHDLGVTLSDDNAKALENLYANNVTSYGEDRWTTFVNAGLINEADFDDAAKNDWIQEHGAEFYTHSLMYYATTERGYQEMYNNNYYYNALQEHLFGEGGSEAPTDETINDYLQSYISDNGIVWARCILFSTQDAADDAAADEVLAQAQAVYDKLALLPADQLSEAFTEKQSQYDKSGYTAGEVQRYSNSDSLVDGYYSAIAALEPGQIAMTEKTDYGYFIVLREADQPDTLRDSVKSSYIMSTYDSLISQWKSEYGVGDVSLNIDAQAFFTKLNELQNTLYSIDNVSGTNTGSDSSAASSSAAAASGSGSN